MGIAFFNPALFIVPTLPAVGRVRRGFRFLPPLGRRSVTCARSETEGKRSGVGVDLFLSPLLGEGRRSRGEG